MKILVFSGEQFSPSTSALTVFISRRQLLISFERPLSATLVRFLAMKSFRGKFFGFKFSDSSLRLPAAPCSTLISMILHCMWRGEELDEDATYKDIPLILFLTFEVLLHAYIIESNMIASRLGRRG